MKNLLFPDKIGRINFLMRHIILRLPLYVVVSYDFYSRSRQAFQEGLEHVPRSEETALIHLFLFLLTITLSLFVAVFPRIKDIGGPWWTGFLFYIPCINFLAWLCLLIFPSGWLKRVRFVDSTPRSEEY